MIRTREKLLQDLEAIENALYSGATKVKYADREIEYASITRLRETRNELLKRLGLRKGKGGYYHFCYKSSFK